MTPSGPTSPESRSGEWQPILEGADADHARAVVDAVLQDESDPQPHWTRDTDDADLAAGDRASLAGGHAGLAVLHAYAAATGRAMGIARVTQHLAAADDALVSYALPSTLFSGFTGIGWAHAHVERMFPAESADFEEIDEVVLQQLASWDGPWELVSGLAGLCVYALERLPDPRAVDMLARAVDRLRTLAAEDEGLLTWFTPAAYVATDDPSAFPHGHFNLGMAHGVPGVVALLGSVACAGQPAAVPLLEKAVPWLLARQLPGEGAAYPGWTTATGRAEPARLAWCYGDTGVAAALLLAADGAGREDWRAAAVTLARRAAARSLESSGVRDAMLCHGSAGIAHIFNRFYQRTGDAVLGEAARDWYRRTLAMQEPGRGIAGYACWTDAGAPHWHADPGLLTGTAGLALALLAAVTRVDPAWDRFLLLSGPPSATAS